MMSGIVYSTMCLLVSFDDGAENKCGEYCIKALEYCNSNPEAYQLMGSYLLSKQDIEVNHCWLPYSLSS